MARSAVAAELFASLIITACGSSTATSNSTAPTTDAAVDVRDALQQDADLDASTDVADADSEVDAPDDSLNWPSHCSGPPDAGALGAAEVIASGRSDLGLIGTSDFGAVWSEDESVGAGSARVILASTPSRVLFDWSGYGNGGAGFRVAGSFFQIHFGGLPNSGDYFAIGNISTGAIDQYSSCDRFPETFVFDSALDESAIFYILVPFATTPDFSNYFARAPLSSPCDTTILAELPKWSNAIAVDGNWLYTLVVEDDGNHFGRAFSIRAAPKNGGPAKIIASGVDPEPWVYAATTIEARNGAVVWTHTEAYGPHLLHVLPATGTTTRALAEPDGLGYSDRIAIAIDDAYVYWTTQTGFVKRVRICGGAPEILASNQDQPIAIAVDDNAVYWLDLGTKPGTGTVMRMRKLDAPGYADASYASTDAGAADASSGDASDAGD